MLVRLAFLVSLVVLATPGVAAQMLPTGTWTGEVVGDGERQPVEAEIERCATGIKVVLAVAGRTAETETATWTDGRLRFQLPRLRMPGTLLPRTLACDLRSDGEGDLSGTCTSGQTPYRLHLSPPADAAFGCD